MTTRIGTPTQAIRFATEILYEFDQDYAVIQFIRAWARGEDEHGGERFRDFCTANPDHLKTFLDDMVKHSDDFVREHPEMPLENYADFKMALKEAGYG